MQVSLRPLVDAGLDAIYARMKDPESLGSPPSLSTTDAASRSPKTPTSNLGYCNFDRAHTGRLTNGRIPGEIVYGARKKKIRR